MKLFCRTMGQLATLILAVSLMTPLWVNATEPVSSPSGTQSGRVVAKVNGAAIYEDQLTVLVQQRLGKFKPNNKGEITAGHRNRLQREALEKIIPSELVYQESLKLVVPDGEEKITRQVDAFKNHPLGNYQGKSDAQLQEMARRQIHIAEYLKINNLLTPEVPEEKIRSLYEQSKPSLAAKEDSVHVRHILIQAAATVTTEQQKQARKRIDEARKLITADNDFADVAREFSEDNAASAGGDIGFIKRGYMPAEFDVIAFALEPGQLSEAIKTEHGYHLLEVLEVHPKGQVPPYEELKDFYGKFLQQQKSRKIVEEHVQTLREKAEILILLDQTI